MLEPDLLGDGNQIMHGAFDGSIVACGRVQKDSIA